jgi:hypothetical protein
MLVETLLSANDILFFPEELSSDDWPQLEEIEKVLGARLFLIA